MGIAAFIAGWPPAEMNPSWLDPAPHRAGRCAVPSFRPARRIGPVVSEEGGVIASVVIALVVIGLVATLGLSGAAHEVVLLGRAGYHAVAGWFSGHRPAVGAGGGG